jgi:anti-anti-sigma factor
VAPLTFETRLLDGDAIVALVGELDMSGVPSLEAEVERLAGEPGVERVVLDLRGLEFLDSSGLRLVGVAARRLSAVGRTIALVRGPDVVQRVFEITRMADRLQFVDAPDGLR